MFRTGCAPRGCGSMVIALGRNCACWIEKIATSHMYVSTSCHFNNLAASSALHYSTLQLSIIPTPTPKIPSQSKHPPIRTPQQTPNTPKSAASAVRKRIYPVVTRILRREMLLAASAMRPNQVAMCAQSSSRRLYVRASCGGKNEAKKKGKDIVCGPDGSGKGSGNEKQVSSCWCLLCGFVWRRLLCGLPCGRLLCTLLWRHLLCILL
jgi:hypothetical protein